jgi:hypothetical protein
VRAGPGSVQWLVSVGCPQGWLDDRLIELYIYIYIYIYMMDLYSVYIE